MLAIGQRHRGRERQDRADEVVEVDDGQHHDQAPCSLTLAGAASDSDAPGAFASSSANFLSRRRNRQAWMTQAETAVGMPHSATRIGSTSMPASCRKVVMSTIAPKATKMSSPKNRPTLSVAAA